MIARALLAFLALPGVVAFAVPWWLRPRGVPVQVAGVPVAAAGLAILVWCVRDFLVRGQGTLAPWDPPRALVVEGLYRYSRNPMYVGVLVLLAGWALAFASRTLWLYALAVAIAFHLRVVLGEEPWLARTHGDAWAAYRARVPRWFGVVRAPGS
ncbi:MAG: isoprenylcysteine carboxylmethyltransferase family protein [Gemmatimonadetes bacterium]|nr:isoprenylcysteine carboxylmethyltransferase family protein [Gemmatimonadota bacterium]